MHALYSGYSYNGSAMGSISYKTWASPAGIIEIGIQGQSIVTIKFANKKIDQSEETPLFNQCIRQLEEFFAGKRTEFSLPLSPEGTDFQKAVWDATSAIPYGETCSYGEVAKAIGRPLASRAVGTALGQNPLCIVVPCHRVLAANGGMGGFAWGLDAKKFLLDVETHHSVPLATTR